ncbi:hypothetical protein R1sor_012569 [Riccia sorocarpa]|uniref:Endonuclease/exonuclease/phosphatase domain-containing protein n=1 Tax=Riccia sorocarpa TaxID=122646 RepID=A0ABD3I452_9MARC
MAEAVGKATSGSKSVHSCGGGSVRIEENVQRQKAREWGADQPEVQSAEVRTNRQVENPKGFQAWMKFRTLDAGKTCIGGTSRGAGPSNSLKDKVGSEEIEDRWAEGITWAVIEEEMAVMPLVNTEATAGEEEIREIDLDVENVAKKLGRFRRTAVVLQALESSPSRDRVVAWVRETMVLRKGVRVCQVKALARREFLIVFNSEEDKKSALTRPPCFIDGRVVRMIEWGDRFRDKLLPHLKAAWVELRDVPPFLEDEATKMLSALGPIVYQTVEKQVEMRYANIRGPPIEVPRSAGVSEESAHKTPEGWKNDEGVGDTWSTVQSKSRGSAGSKGQQDAGEIRSNCFFVLQGSLEDEQERVGSDESWLAATPPVGEKMEVAALPKCEKFRPNTMSDSTEQGSEDFYAMMVGKEVEGVKVMAVGSIAVLEGDSSIKEKVQSEEALEKKVERMVEAQKDVEDTEMGVELDSEVKEVGKPGVELTDRIEENLEKEELAENDRESEGEYENLWKALKELRREKGVQKGKKKAGRERDLGRQVPLEVEKIALDEDNPFKSRFSVLSKGKDKDKFDLGHEVSFEGGECKIGEGSRGPKKKVRRRVESEETENRNPIQSEEDGPQTEGMEVLKNVRWTQKVRRFLMCTSLKIVGWNVRGVTRATKAQAVKQWLTNKVGGAQIIGLQELKSSSWSTSKWLAGLKKKGTVVYDKPIGSKGGTALVLHESIVVSDKGTGGNGRLAWVRAKVGEKEMGFMSIHAPSRRKVRIQFWQQVNDIIGAGDWIVLRDFNQVEMQEDARGKSTVVKGREERVWKHMSLEKGLVDSFYCAASIEGVRFTRMARRKSRYDWSRLDRVYCTRGADWIDHIKQVTHFASSSLSDHCPVGIDVQVVPEEDARKHESYFKMNHFDLGDTEVMWKVREVWSNETEVVRDNRRRWARGWNRVKQVLKEARDSREQKRREEGNLTVEVAWRTARISEESSIEEVYALARAESRLRTRELHDAKEWRTRSREKWLKVDEAPSGFFFAKMSAKWARERIDALVTTEGEVTTDRGEILEEIAGFYQSLYVAEEGTIEKEEAREEVVGLLQPGLT